MSADMTLSTKLGFLASWAGIIWGAWRHDPVFMLIMAGLLVLHGWDYRPGRHGRQR